MTLHHLDTCHDCGRVLHDGVFCSGCLAWSDHRPTPAEPPVVPRAAAGSTTGGSGAVRAESTAGACGPIPADKHGSLGVPRPVRSDNDD